MLLDLTGGIGRRVLGQFESVPPLSLRGYGRAMRRRRQALAVVATIACVIGGCGGGSGKSLVDEIAEEFQSLLRTFGLDAAEEGAEEVEERSLCDAYPTRPSCY